MIQDDIFESPSIDMLTKEGEKFYLDELWRNMEEKHLGEYVVIEPRSKEYFVDDDLLEALEKANRKHPNKFFTIIKVGTFKPPTNYYQRKQSHYAGSLH